MANQEITERIAGYVERLCDGVGNRVVGAPGNRRATAFLRRKLHQLGFEVETSSFACLDWQPGPVWLRAGGDRFAASVSPYSRPFSGAAILVEAASLRELESKRISDRILLLRGELCREPLMPKNFVFYNPDGHRRLIALLEAKRPAAVIAATGPAPTGGGAAPFPLFDDGDFEIPSVYLKARDGERLARRAGSPVRLAFRSRRIRAKGENVIATRRGRRPGRIVLTAHVDARKGTPGALDNAAGVAVLLAVAGMFDERPAGPSLELAFLNGEDYFAVPGQMAYLAANRSRWREIRLAVNLDGVGYRRGRTAYSFYRCPPALRKACISAFAGFPGLTRGPEWFQGDHSLFVQPGVPAVAFTSERAARLAATVIHTERDTATIVSPAKLAELAAALVNCIRRISAVSTVS